ncbi:MAG: hypothetical protein GX537_10315 [Actinobacteria bacterium]|nr:hypothetical protein [Actinomycetota bacterium]
MSRRPQVVLVALVVLFALVALLLPGALLAFPDVTADNPYRTAIDNLASRNIIGGYENGNFGPNDPVQRAQFAKMIVLALDETVTEGAFPNPAVPFVDLGVDDVTKPYPHEYVAVCALKNITRGTDDTHFSPWLNISRAQVITMIVRAIDNTEPGLLRNSTAGQTGTLGLFDTTHGPTMLKAEVNGLLAHLQGFSASWKPWQDMTRGEVAQVLYNVVMLMEEEEPGDEVPVLSVVDGDTIRVIYEGEEEAVRLIGFDTPENGEPFAAEAEAYLRQLVGGKQVHLEFDVEQRDLYQRLLAYVWAGTKMANAEMLRQGLATLYTVAPNVKYTDIFAAAEAEARQAKRGIWAQTSGCPIEIMSIHPDAAGNDNYNLNDEWIEFRVLVAGSLIGYSVEDEAGHTYFFPDRVFAAEDVFKLRTGSGTDTQADLFWNASGSAIWNNSGDTIKILDPQGHVLLTRTY